jgi:hypothetical protein
VRLQRAWMFTDLYAGRAEGVAERPGIDEEFTILKAERANLARTMSMETLMVFSTRIIHRLINDR